MTSTSARLAEPDRQRIDEAIAGAQRWTEAEILAVVAARSGGDERAAAVAGVLVAMASAAAGAAWSAPAVAVAALVAVGFAAGAAAARGHAGVRRALTQRGRRRAAVAGAAEAALADRRLRSTDRPAGLLLYVSLLERAAAVRADPRVRDALAGDALEQVEARLEAAVRAGDVAGGLVDAVRTLGEQLAPALPRPAAWIDEPPNALVVRG